MKYSYDEFAKKLKQSGLEKQFSESDLKLAQQDPNAGMGLITAKLDYAAATTTEGKANANRRAEALRQTYGNYNAGVNGSGYTPGSRSPDTFSHTQFSYQPQTDELFQAYKKQYTRQGRQAIEDTLGNLAASSGGMPSSYAATAANQAGNVYAAALSDKIPQLYADAYKRHQDERDFTYRQHKDEYASDMMEKEDAFKQAQTAAGFGDYRFLQRMGVDTSNYLVEREFANKLTQQEKAQQAEAGRLHMDYAQLAAKLKDYEKVKEMTGITANTSGERMEYLYQIASQLAKGGDYSLLYQLLSMV